MAVRNLPGRMTQQEFLYEVNRSGFVGTYDFAYLPRSRDSGRGSGHAFVNFKSPELAVSFKAVWNGSSHLGAKQDAEKLSVVPSSVQGFSDNTTKWTPSRLAQVKNASYLPFIQGPTPMADCGEWPKGCENCGVFLVKNSSIDTSKTFVQELNEEHINGEPTGLVLQKVPPRHEDMSQRMLNALEEMDEF